MDDATKLRRQHERKAKRMNAAEAKAYGPLFAHLAPVYTADDAEHRWRRAKAIAAEFDIVHPFHQAIKWVVVAHIERWAAKAVGADVASTLAASARRCYPNADYIRDAWKRLLTGRESIVLTLRVECRPELANAYNREGKRVIEERWGPVDLLSPEEFDRLFPSFIRHDEHPETPDEQRFGELSLLTRGHDE